MYLNDILCFFVLKSFCFVEYCLDEFLRFLTKYFWHFHIICSWFPSGSLPDLRLTWPAGTNFSDICQFCPTSISHYNRPMYPFTYTQKESIFLIKYGRKPIFYWKVQVDLTLPNHWILFLLNVSFILEHSQKNPGKNRKSF